jgi:hypothetical protein
VSQIKLGRRKFEDKEAEIYENCLFEYQNKEDELRCQILTLLLKTLHLD